MKNKMKMKKKNNMKKEEEEEEDKKKKNYACDKKGPNPRHNQRAWCKLVRVAERKTVKAMTPIVFVEKERNWSNWFCSKYVWCGGRKMNLHAGVQIHF